MKLEFYQYIFEKKIFKCKISWKSVQWEPSCSMRTDGRTDRRDEANICSSRFCELAHKKSEVQLTCCAPWRHNGEEDLSLFVLYPGIGGRFPPSRSVEDSAFLATWRRQWAIDSRCFKALCVGYCLLMFSYSCILNYGLIVWPFIIILYSYTAICEPPLRHLR